MSTTDSDSRSSSLQPPPAKRRKGRPVETSTFDSNVAEKRARGRQAQQAFRLRREAALRSLEERAAALETSIEQMSNLFGNFVDNALSSKDAFEDRDFIQSCQTTLEQFVKLAGQASSDEEDRDSSPPSSEGRQTSPKQLPTPPSSDEESKKEKELPHKSQKWDTNTLIPLRIGRRELLIQRSWEQYLWRSTRSQVPMSISVDYTLPDCHVPEPNMTVAEALNMHPLGFKLVTTTFEVAYHALLNDGAVAPHLSHSTIVQTTLLWRERHHMLGLIRRYIGPERDRLTKIADVILDMDHIKRSMDPLYAGLTLAQQIQKLGNQGFVNAYGVEKYLRSKGAFHFDRQTVQMRMQVPIEQPPTTDSAPSVTVTPPSPEPPRYVAPPPEIRKVFNFNSITPAIGPGKDYSWPDASKVIPQKTLNSTWKVVTLSVDSLIEKLTKMCICGGGGPGYPIIGLNEAIKASIVSAA